MGGGVEIALSAAYRSISAGAGALALPECFLGLVPGWGGCYLLPNLIGVESALKVIIENPLNTNRMLKGPQAFELGIADVLFEPVTFLEDSLSWAADVITGRTVVDRPEIDRDEAVWEGAIAAAKGLVKAKTGGAAPAPLRALQLVSAARTATREEAYAAEDDALADLLMGDELRASLYSFDLVQKRAKRPAGRSRPLAGTPGHQGRYRRRRPDGQPAGPAVRPAARGPDRDDRPRSGSRGQGRGLRPRRDRQAARPRADQPGPGQPAQGPGQRFDEQGRLCRCRLRHRGGLRGDHRQEAGVRRGRGGGGGRLCAGDEHVLALDHRRWPRT